MNAQLSMRAAVIESAGGAFHIITMARPVPQDGQVLVKIMASAVNPLDLKIRAGDAAHAKHPVPAILGIDMAGVVESIGPGVTAFHIGDEVYGMTGGVGGVQGSLAEYAAVDARLLALKPANLSMRQAAALPLVFITAWEGLVDRVHLHERQSVLVHGGAGGVGHMAIQIALSLGASVYATGSAVDADFIAELGATPIDYGTSTVEDYVAGHTGGRGFDVIYDTVGGANLDTSFKAIARFGHVISALGWGTHALAPLSFRAGSYSGVFTLLPLLSGEGRAHHGEIMRESTRLAESGKLHPRLDDRRFDLHSVGDAHALLEQKAARGKVIVDINS